MTDDTIPTNSEGAETSPNIDITLGTFQDTMDAFIATADVSAVYGEPIQHGNTLIIPAAEVLNGMGFGIGFGGGSSPSKEGKEDKGEGGGGGGGGRVFARPVAVVIASPEGVRVEPVVDVTKIALAFFTAIGFMVGMVARMNRPRVTVEDCCEE
jgi:uncharacterized spore protein YtfJ